VDISVSFAIPVLILLVVSPKVLDLITLSEDFFQALVHHLRIVLIQFLVHHLRVVLIQFLVHHLKVVLIQFLVHHLKVVLI
jgi:hypothetical protein